MNLTDDDFTLFGLPRSFVLDRAALDERWRALQARVHPDRFVSEGAAAQRLAMQWSVRVNEAYRRLKDPIARATLLCELGGAPLRAEENTAMPSAFLVQQMAWREALDEAGAAPGDERALQALEDEVANHEVALMQRLAGELDLRSDVHAAAGTVRELMFVARFREDVSHRRDALAA